MNEEFQKALQDVYAEGVVHVDLAEGATADDLKELLKIVKEVNNKIKNEELTEIEVSDCI